MSIAMTSGEQERANAARLRAQFAYKVTGTWSGKALTRIQGLSVEMRSLGLTIVVALLIREKKDSLEIAQSLARWLLRDCPIRTLATSSATPEALLKAAVEADRSCYLATQAEALRLADVLKLMASARKALAEVQTGHSTGSELLPVEAVQS